MPASASSGIVDQSLDIIDTITAYSDGIIIDKPKTIIPSLTPNPDGANILKIPIIAAKAKIPEAYSAWLIGTG